MLTLLRISGFALIDELELPLGPGLTAVTGETGAGKSILVDALGLLRGGRAGADVIRTGRDEARVEAILELPPGSATRARLVADGREVEEGLVVRRVIARGGRGRAHLGGGLATAADLASTVAGLIDIASQHDQQSLTDPESQLAILDAFAENQPLRDEMTAAYAARADAAAALATFSADARARGEREDLLRFQLAELEAAGPAPGEDDALAAERERLKGAERFLAATARGEETLYAGDGAVAERLAGVARELAPLASLDPALAPLVERLADAQAAIEDVARDLGRYARGIRSDPARLEEVEERLFLLQRLCRKHGGTVADLAAKQSALRGELAELGLLRGGAGRAASGGDAAEARATAAATALGASRRQAAGSLEKKVNAVLRELGFASARLPVAIEAARARPERRRPGSAAVRAQPRRRGAPAGQDRLGGRAVAGHAGGQADAGAHGRGADLRVRRGRRRRRRRHGRDHRPQAEAPGGRSPGHRHHAPPAGRRLRRRPRAGHQDRARAARRASRSGGSTTPTAPARSRACWRAPPRRPRRPPTRKRCSATLALAEVQWARRR